MIKFENVEVFGWEAALRGMRNPLESWSRCDSDLVDNFPLFPGPFRPTIGPNDKSLMTRLRNAGKDHRKFMRMIVAYADVVAPVYWWAEFDTYKVGTVRNSCSFMHKGASKEFEPNMFSWHGLDGDDSEYVDVVLDKLNFLREKYLKTKDPTTFQQLRDACPQGLNVRSTVMLNYEVLANMYASRRSHRLEEWKEFCKWIESLPASWLVTGKDNSSD